MAGQGQLGDDGEFPGLRGRDNQLRRDVVRGQYGGAGRGVRKSRRLCTRAGSGRPGDVGRHRNLIADTRSGLSDHLCASDSDASSVVTSPADQGFSPQPVFRGRPGTRLLHAVTGPPLAIRSICDQRNDRSGMCCNLESLCGTSGESSGLPMHGSLAGRAFLAALAFQPRSSP